MRNPLQLELEKQFALDLKGSLLLRLFSWTSSFQNDAETELPAI